jgi:[CysO sulfur-carrier protein]-S-L-cysteine hydrolase
MSNVIRIRKEALARMREEAGRTPGEECCGLLAGRDGVISVILPAANALASGTAFEIAPAELFRLMKKIRADGLELLGIYHSHPAGESKPSARDIECAFYPDAAYFIVSPPRDAPQAVRAFSICEGRVTELIIEPV